MIVRASALLLLAALCAAGAGAADFRSTAAPGAVLYDAPSIKARKLFLLGQGYPLEVLVTLSGWCKVRDASGELSWVQARTLVPQRKVMINVPVAEVRRAPEPGAPVVFQAEREVLLDFVEAAADGWVRVQHPDGESGYVRAGDLWGV